MEDNVGGKLRGHVHEGMIPGNADVLRRPILPKTADVDQKVTAIHRVSPTIGIHGIVEGRLTVLNDPHDTRKFDGLRLSPEGGPVIDVHISRDGGVVDPLRTREVAHVLRQGITFWDRVRIVAQDVVTLGKEDSNVKGMGLPLVFLNPDGPQTGIFLLELMDDLRGGIGTAIIHHQDLVIMVGELI